jgi:hypothetical protein
MEKEHAKRGIPMP